MSKRLSFILLLAAVFVAREPWAQTSPPDQPKPAAQTSAITPKANRNIPETLMFSVDEVTDIRSHMASGTANEKADAARKSEAIENSSLYLSTIVYSSRNDWTIWVNGQPINPGQDFTEFRVTDIGPHYVELVVPLSAQGMRPVRLEPNQTFITKSGAVVEGSWKQ